MKIVSLQGPSGSGKTTIQKKLGITKVVSLTTREKRHNEKEGVDYHFVTKDTMLKMKNGGELIEVTEYNGHFYATSYESLRNVSEKEIHSIVVDHSGAKVLKETFKEMHLSIGIFAPREDCARRLRERGGEALSRLSSYESDVSHLFECDLIILNSDNNYTRACEIASMIRQELIKRMGNH